MLGRQQRHWLFRRRCFDREALREICDERRAGPGPEGASGFRPWRPGISANHEINTRLPSHQACQVSVLTMHSRGREG